MQPPSWSSSPTRPPISRGRRARLLLALLLGALGVLGGTAAPAALAATGQVTIQSNDVPPLPQSHPTGTPSRYTINFECSTVGTQSCGDDPVIRVPFSLTAPVDPATPAMDTWIFQTSSSISGLILDTEIVGGELVIRLDSTKVNPGDSQTIQLAVTPPNNVTPDQTRWSLGATFETDDLPQVSAPQPALGLAHAEAKISVSKVTDDGSSFLVRGRNVVYNITARCNPSGSTGNLHLTEGSLVDVLPAGLNFVSASPAPTSAPAVGSNGTIVWDYPSGSALPSGCAAGASGTQTYQVVASVDPSVPDDTQLENEVTFNGLPIGETTEQSTSAPRTIRVIDLPPTVGPGIIGKGAAAPLEVSGAGYRGTYPGDWIPGNSTQPSTTNPASAEGRWTVNVRYPASGAFTTDLIDPMPCQAIESPAGVFHSSAVTGPTTPGGAPTVDEHCTNPVFHPTVVRVDAASLNAAIVAGWRPTAILTTGGGATEVPLELVGSGTDTGRYFTVPAANVEQVSAIRLPPHTLLRDASMDLRIFGYADEARQGGDVLHNIASVTAYPTAGTDDPYTAADDDRILIEQDEPQIGVHKAFGGLRGGPGGTTRLNLTATVATGAEISGDVVIADLLPFGLKWSNPTTSVSYNLTNTPGGTSSTVTGTVEHLENYQSTGRDLIRVTFPASAFGSGFNTVSLPTTSNFILLDVPNGATTYNNTVNAFIKGIGRDTSPACGPGTTSTASTFESEDPLDLDGDGVTAENNCSWNADLVVPPSGGPAFGLVKSVQGDQDVAPKFSPGVGNAAEGGTGDYVLKWSNIGGETLTDPVIYDILPHIGDTGTTQSQAGTARGSAFDTEFVQLNGSLPSGVTVEYSQSTNPCRPEVYPNAANPSCVDDWSSSLPSDPADVKALRFAASGTYAPAASFEVGFRLRVPVGYVNIVAWNSAASVASFNGSPLLPAEPPKVGITAPTDPVTPVLSTEVSRAKVVVGTAVSDTVTLANTGGASGDIDWQLVGPRPAGSDGTCDAVNWTGAALVDSGTVAFQGNGDYDTPTTTLTDFGCYSYVVTATSPQFAGGEVSHPAGAPNEVVQVAPVVARLSTQVSQAAVTPGDAFRDTITLTDADEAAGTIDWQLVGPKPIGTDGTCDAVDWTGAAQVAHGSLPFDGNGDYVTPTSDPTGAGCYSYVVSVDSPQFESPASHPAGEPGEVVLVRPATIVTAASSLRIAPGAEITDRVDLTGTGGGTGTLEWKVVGPIRANAEGTCENLDWSGAQTFDSGTIAVDGDGTYHTDPSTPTETGCYSYVQLLNASSAGGPSLHAAGEPNEMFYVGRPTVETTVSSAAILPGGSVLDTIEVRGTGGGAGELQWKLYGPVVPGVGDTCLGLNWAGAAVVAQGTIPVTGDGSYLTPPTLPLMIAGCYGYEVTLTGKDYGDPVVSPAGTPGELTLVKAPIVPQSVANVSITKTASHRNVRAGRAITYTLTATNNGPGVAENVVINDTPRSGMTFVSASTDQGTCTTRFPLDCNVGSIAPGGKVAVRVVAIPTVSGTVVNGARVSTTTPNESPANEVVADSRVTVKVPVRISKRASAKTVGAGKRVTFTVTVANRTKVATGRSQVCDRMPSGLVMVSVKGAKVTRKGGQHCWTVPALKPGKSKSYRVTARVLRGAKGKQTNRVTIKGDSVQTKHARATVRVRSAPVRAGGVTG